MILCLTAAYYFFINLYFLSKGSLVKRLFMVVSISHPTYVAADFIEKSSLGGTESCLLSYCLKWGKPFALF